MVTSLGYARMELTYDYAGNKTSEAYFDAELKPTSVYDGYHRAVYSWDAEGRMLSEEYYDANVERVLSNLPRQSTGF